VETKTAELKIAKASLEKVNSRIRELEKMFNEKIAEKDRLTKEINDCEIKLERA
jgi:dynein heavy chain